MSGPACSGVEIRPFRRSDRAQVTRLVNAHVAAVVPGVTVSVNGVMSQLEREPGEFVVDPWVVGRAALVAEQRGRVVAAALLLRYGSGPDVGEVYRDAGEIRWLLCWPDAPYWPDARLGGQQLVADCLTQFRAWGVHRRYAGGSLPAPGVYGLPEQWPHLRSLLEGAGFVADGQEEIVLLAEVSRLPAVADVQVEEITPRRSLGVNGTRLAGWGRDELLGYIEVDTDLDTGSAPGRLAGWADVGNLEVCDRAPAGTADWLLAHAGEWLRLAGVRRLLAYCEPSEVALLTLLRGHGFTELTRTLRGMHLP